MKKNISKIILLVFTYLVSLILCGLIFGAMQADENEKYMVEHGYGGPFALLVPFVEACIYHFIFVSILAICIIFIKKIPSIIKNTIYLFPLLDIFLSWPMMIPTVMLANLLRNEYVTLMFIKYGKIYVQTEAKIPYNHFLIIKYFQSFLLYSFHIFLSISYLFKYMEYCIIQYKV